MSSHAPGCDCAHHRPASQSGGKGAWLPAALAFAACAVCAVCPACLSAYAKIFAALGIGLALSEAQHVALLSVALGVSMLVSAWRSWRGRRWMPVVVAAVGTALVVAGHVAGFEALEWSGILGLFVGGIVEHPSVRRWRTSTAQAA